jgi:hypothetical protein
MGAKRDSGRTKDTDLTFVQHNKAGTGSCRLGVAGLPHRLTEMLTLVQWCPKLKKSKSHR